MDITRPFILRPVATSLLMVAILLMGLLAYRSLPVAALPQVDYPTIQVTSLYPGASPEVVTSSITAPLERQFGQMAGLKQMSSTSSGGASVLTLRFGLDVGLDVAEQEVQAAINAASSLLPQDLPLPPVYSKVNPADAPILTLAVTSPALDVTRINDFVETRVAMKISQIQGVGLVSIAGGRRPAVRIQVHSEALSKLGLSMEDLRNAIGATNVNMSKGGFDGKTRASTINANDQLKTAAEYEQVVIAYKNGAPVRLGDVATLLDGAENSQLAAWANTQEAVILNIRRQPGANVIEVAERVKQTLPQLQASLPSSLDVRVLSDRTETIRASVRSVQMELVLAVVLVTAVIFLFLRSWRATLIPSLAVPLSLIGTFAVMQWLGFSLNNLSLMALVISTGFVVDDAIVMIENISRHVEESEPPMQAALKGARQIGFTIISLTVSLIAVLIPLLFMADVVGRLFFEFAVTLSIAILISAVVSLTLTPMMCARMLKHVPEAEQGEWSRRTGQWFQGLVDRYELGLNWVLEHRATTLTVAVGTLLLTVLMFVFIPKGFFPAQDTGSIQGMTLAAQSISFQAMSERQQALTEALLTDPAVESISSFIGVDGLNPTLNSGRLQISLKPLKERAPAHEVMARLNEKALAVSGIELFLQPVQDLTIEGTVSRTQYQFTLTAPSLDLLGEWVPPLLEGLKALPQLQSVSSDLQNEGLQAYVNIDRLAAGRLGVSVSAIDNALYNAYGQRLISTIFTQSNQYRVILERKPGPADGLQTLGNLYVPGAGGVQVPLSAVARIEERPTALAINHLAQFPSTTVSFNLSEGASLGEAVQAIREVQQGLNLPLSISTQFQGAAQAFEASLSNTVWLILAAIVTVYIVLGVLYESTIHPVTILSTLPSAGVGALLALWLGRHGLDMVGIIGMVLLIGIVKKNAIMMIDFALEAERHQGLSPREAIHQACLLRFRPILMTTMAALLGALPLMFSTGFGAELRQPLGYALVGGLILSQLLTLYTTPVIYLAFDQWFSPSKGLSQLPQEDVPA